MKSVRSPFLSPRACQWIDRCRLIFALFSVSSFFAGSFFAFAVVAAVAGTSGTKKKAPTSSCSQAPGSVNPQLFNSLFVLSITQVRRHFLTFFKQSSPSAVVLLKSSFFPLTLSLSLSLVVGVGRCSLCLTHLFSSR